MVRISNPPAAESLMIGARSIGNYDLAAALGDLIDNSITANANTVSLICNFNSGDPLIIIKDNGFGMDKKTLVQAMRPASSNPHNTRNAEDLGRFGWGLKSASFSQARRLIVATRRDSELNMAIWDLDDIVDFQMDVLESAEALLVLEEYSETLPSNGTIIIWDKCDRLSETSEITQIEFNEKVIDARKQLELIFHQYLDSQSKNRLSIYLNGSELKGYDPFLSSHPATQSFHTEKIEIFGSGYIAVTPYVLPHYSKLDQQTINNIEGSNGLVRNQGFYVYRNKRLIIHGTWFGIFKYGELSDLVRVKIEIPNTMDHIWQISIDKKDAKLPQSLKLRLKKQLTSIHSKSKKVHKRRSKAITLGDPTNIWTKVKKNGRSKFEINRESAAVKSIQDLLPQEEIYKFNYLLNYIEEMLPVSNIISSETAQDSDLIQNETNNAAARGLGRHLARLIFEDFQGNAQEFRDTLQATSYFINQRKLAAEIADELLSENNQ